MIQRSGLCRVMTALSAAVLSVFCITGPAHADVSDSEHLELNRFLSGHGTVAFIAAGTLLPMVEDGSSGFDHSMHAANALATSVVLSEGLKYAFHEQRPNGGNHDSFPSGHTTAAFAVATVQSRYHPDQAFLWYAGATAIGVSRVSLHRHYVHDVVAGAALGYLAASTTLSHRRLLFRPEFGPDPHAVGVTVHLDF